MGYYFCSITAHTKCYQKALKTGYFRDLYVLDSYGDGKQLNLADAKAFLFAVIDKNRSHWEAIAEIEEIKDMIRQVRTFDELMQLFETTLQ